MEISELQKDLAAAFRWTARLNSKNKRIPQNIYYRFKYYQKFY